MEGAKPLLLGSASLIGIILIGLIGEQLEPGLTRISDIDSSMLNRAVHVRGVVAGIDRFSAGIGLFIEQEGARISITYFTKDAVTAYKGLCADVLGEVKTDKGSMAIEANGLYLFMC